MPQSIPFATILLHCCTKRNYNSMKNKNEEIKQHIESAYYKYVTESLVKIQSKSSSPKTKAQCIEIITNLCVQKVLDRILLEPDITIEEIFHVAENHTLKEAISLLDRHMDTDTTRAKMNHITAKVIAANHKEFKTQYTIAKSELDAQ